jgi:hypothetical protein
VQGTSPVTFKAGVVAYHPGGGVQRIWDQQLAVMQYAYCQQNIVVIEEELHDGQRGKQSGLVSWRGIHWWPTPGSMDLGPDIPSDVASAYSEGMRALSVKAPRAAVVMFRGMLAHFVKDKGSAAAQAKNSLYHSLEQMSQDGSLHPSLVEWAKEIRVLGNAAAHPDSLDPVSEDEAAELGRLCRELLRVVYEIPASITRSRAARGLTP